MAIRSITTGAAFTLLASTGCWAFSPAITPTPKASALNAISGHEKRSSWETYAPYSPDGRVGSYGEIGCPGGGDWCDGGGGDGSSVAAEPTTTTAAANVANTLASLGASSPKKSYGIGSWNKSSSPSWMMGRRPIVAGNWKLNPASRSEAIDLLESLAANFRISKISAPEAVIFPPLPYIADACKILEGTGILVGAQNAGPNEMGAFTGEIAPSMLVSCGCSYVLLGHSERRTLFGETDTHINSVLHKCLEQDNLKVILCVGETLEEYENGMLEQVVDTQIRHGLEGVDGSVLLSDRVVIAYEPVWAIGTGLVATPNQAQAAHVTIRNSLANLYGSEDVATSVRIQYGGSVTPDSIEQLMGEMDVDGALVGGASLIADSFTKIFEGAA